MAPKSLTSGKFYRYIHKNQPMFVQLTYVGEDGLWRANNLATEREVTVRKPKLLIDAGHSMYGYPLVDTMIRYKVIHRPVGHKNRTKQLQYGHDSLDLCVAKELAKMCAREHVNEVASLVATTWFMAGHKKLWRFMYDDEGNYREMELLDGDEITDEKEKADLQNTYFWRRRKYNAKGEEVEFTNADREGEEEKGKQDGSVAQNDVR